MIGLLKILLAILMMFTAIGLACAVRIGRRRPPPADPFSHPFGDVAPLPAGSIVELHSFNHPARPATRTDQGSGGNGNSLSGAAAARTYHGIYHCAPHGGVLQFDKPLTAEDAAEIKRRWSERHAR